MEEDLMKGTVRRIDAVNTQLRKEQEEDDERLEDALNLYNLRKRLEKEEGIRADADTAITERLDKEEQVRADADTAIIERLEREEQVRADADTAIIERLDKEEQARADADTAIIARLDSIEAELDNDISAGYLTVGKLRILSEAYAANDLKLPESLRHYCPSRVIANAVAARDDDLGSYLGIDFISPWEPTTGMVYGRIASLRPMINLSYSISIHPAALNSGAALVIECFINNEWKIVKNEEFSFPTYEKWDDGGGNSPGSMLTLVESWHSTNSFTFTVDEDIQKNTELKVRMYANYDNDYGNSFRSISGWVQADILNI